MHHFFTEPSRIDIESRRVIIAGEDAAHIKNVLRMKRGEEVSVSNGYDGKEYRCAVLEFKDGEVVLELLFIREEENELPVNVTLYQGLPKADKMELIIQKCVELGVSRIVPVAMKRCVVRLDKKKGAAKRERWQAIAQAAAEQSRRGIIPRIDDVMSFEEAVLVAAKCDVGLMPYELSESSGMEQTRKVIGGIKKGESVSVVIGPEGGFDNKEAERARAEGLELITLGRRILRTETAGMTVMGWIALMTEGRD